jgi:F-type H+-transporting ATPase subunit gamma
MATLREVRARISGVKKTQKITKAMKMVAAAKLRRAQTAVVAARPYARSIGALLKHLVQSVDTSLNPLLAPRDVQSVALVVVTSDRGLCGAFNASLIRAAVNHIETNYAQVQREDTLRIFCIGKKGLDYFAKRHYKVAGSYIGVYNNLVYGQAQAIAREIVEGYLKGEFDRVEVVYNEFKSVAQQRIIVEQFLPVPTGSVEDTEKPARPSTIDYIYEPSAVAVVNALVPCHLHFQIWKMLLESNAAEQGARMAAMDNATENANEMISHLQLVYNKARQASITKELLEVVGGAEALKKTG